MKKLLILLLLFPLFVHAQLKPSKEFSVEVSKPYPVIDGAKFYFYMDGEIRMLKITKRNIVLQRFNYKTSREISRKILPSVNKEESVIKVAKIKSKVYLFTRSFSKKKKELALNVYQVNFKASHLGGKRKLLVNTGIQSKIVDRFHFYFSYDSTSILIESRLPVKYKSDKKNYDKIMLAVFDSDLSEQWSKNITMPYTEAKMNNKDYCVNSDGQVFILAEVFKTDVSKLYVKGKKNFNLEVLGYDGENKIKYQVKDNAISINEARFKEGPEGELYLAGYYSKSTKRKNRDNSDGVFYIRLEEDGFSTVKSYEFPINIMNDYISAHRQSKNKKKKRKGKLSFQSLVLRNMIIGKDGSVFLIGEQYFVVTTTTSSSNGVMTTSYTFHYNDILVTKIDANGNLEWMQKIPKRQISGTPEGEMSFRYIYKDGVFYFLYIDNLKNINLPKNQSPSAHVARRGGIITIAKIDDDGKLTRSYILDMNKVKVPGFKKPLRVHQFSMDRILEIPGGIAFEVYKKKKQDVMIEIKAIHR